MRRHAHNPGYWFKQAKELDRAAMVIWESIRADFMRLSKLHVGSEITAEQAANANLGGVFWLLAGFALENAFKGIIISNDSAVVVDGRIKRSLGTHDLLRLARRASFALSPGETFYLRVATECTTWAGRYPSSMKGGETGLLLFSEADVNVYREIYDRLASELEFEIPSVTLRRFV